MSKFVAAFVILLQSLTIIGLAVMGLYRSGTLERATKAVDDCHEVIKTLYVPETITTDATQLDVIDCSSDMFQETNYCDYTLVEPLASDKAWTWSKSK